MSKTNATAAIAEELAVISAAAQHDKPKPPQYDADANQKIPLPIIEKGGKNYEVAIELSPITDEDYFQLMDDVAAAARRIKIISIDLFEPFAELGRRKAVARYGYKERDDWKTATRNVDYISAVKSYFHVSAEPESVDTKELLDDDAATQIRLLPSFAGREVETFISFREENKAQMDEFLAALSGQPNKSALASSKKVSKERRVYELYEQLQVGSENYLNRIPAWHCVEAVTMFLNLEILRMGK
ncbi:MAG: hypothetical protein LH472_02110 [Pyrinomonadaceae bacterium]|nr:hypothetical protein [Pyrinomonadaceae bacterium]